MPTRWLYCPWPDFQGDPIEKTVQRYLSKHGAKDGRASDVQVVRHGHWRHFGSKPLQNIRKSDMLLILAHGAPRHSQRAGSKDNNNIGYTKPKMINRMTGGVVSEEESYTITCKEFAKQLKADGLPRTHIFVKCLTCFGGGLGLWIKKAQGEGGEVVFNPSANEKHGAHFACQLAQALFALSDRPLSGFQAALR